jgi:hypothetical protein
MLFNNTPNQYNLLTLQDIDKFLQGERQHFINSTNAQTFPTLTIATHNINGIKTNINKLHNLINTLEKHDIIGLNEMNLTKKEGSYINKQITTGSIIWSTKTSNKYKGAGAAIYFNEKWFKHIGKVTNPSENI